MEEKVVAFIPIKLNNQRLPGKNLMSLKGKPLCRYLFETLAQVQGIDEKYVFCSDEKICEYIPEELTFFKRNTNLDGPEVKGLDIIGNFVENVDADIYVITHVTSPFMKRATFETGLDKIKREGYDSAFTVESIQQYCWFDDKPINYTMNDIVTTQNLKPVYIETGGYFMFRKEVFTKLRQRIGLKPYICVTDRWESVEIDTKTDFQYAEIVAELLKKEGRI